MKKILLAAALAVAPTLAACSPGEIASTPAPGSYADRTKVDEQAMAGAEIAYAAALKAANLAIDAGMVDALNAPRVAELDRRAYAALVSARAAYRVANAGDLAVAIGQALALADNLKNATGR